MSHQVGYLDSHLVRDAPDASLADISIEEEVAQRCDSPESRGVTSPEPSVTDCRD